MLHAKCVILSWRAIVPMRLHDFHPRGLLLLKKLLRWSWQMFEKPTLEDDLGRTLRKHGRYWAAKYTVSLYHPMSITHIRTIHNYYKTGE
jgi:hypothetical protein